jgi:hypothetical protein
MAEIFFRAWWVARTAALACDRTLDGFCRSLLLLLSASLIAPKLAEVRVVAQRRRR